MFLEQKAHPCGDCVAADGMLGTLSQNVPGAVDEQVIKLVFALHVFNMVWVFISPMYEAAAEL